MGKEAYLVHTLFATLAIPTYLKNSSMVQFKPPPRRPTLRGRKKAPEYNEYWKLDSRSSLAAIKEYLTAKGFAFKSSVRRDRADKLLERCQRGLIAYDNQMRPAFCELQSVAHACGIDFDEKIKNGALLELIEKHDDDITFDLLRLPPELRSRIYEYHFDSLPTLPLQAHQPPICLATRLLRNEALPLFYSRCRFVLEYQALCNAANACRRVLMASTTAQVLAAIGPDNTGRMRRIEVAMLGEPDFKWRLDLRDREKPVAISRFRVEPDGHYHFPDPHSRRTRERVAAELNTEAARFQKSSQENGVKRFEPQALTSVLQRGFCEVIELE